MKHLLLIFALFTAISCNKNASGSAFNGVKLTIAKDLKVAASPADLLKKEIKPRSACVLYSTCNSFGTTKSLYIKKTKDKTLEMKNLYAGLLELPRVIISFEK